MTLDEILLLPLVETYKLDDEPVDFDDLVELCDGFEDHRDSPELGYILFPVGEHDPDPFDTCEGEPVYYQTYAPIEVLKAAPIVFRVQDDNITDYGVVDGSELRVYRYKDLT